MDKQGLLSLRCFVVPVVTAPLLLVSRQTDNRKEGFCLNTAEIKQNPFKREQTQEKNNDFKNSNDSKNWVTCDMTHL